VGISAQQVKQLRDQTGAGMMDCKRALTDAEGDFEKAVRLLRERGIAAAEKRSARAMKEGVVFAYIHPGNRIGAMVEVSCETDFVARNQRFVQLAKDLAMQIAGHQPAGRYVRREDVPEEVLEAEKEIYATQARNEGKPEKIIPRIVEGKLQSFFKQYCLLEQEFIRESDKVVGDLIKEHIAEFGENIQVRRFVLFQVGES
jgi:elongation factor Ts